MPKPIRSQVYVNSRGNYCVGGYAFRKAQPVIGISALPVFELFELVAIKVLRDEVMQQTTCKGCGLPLVRLTSSRKWEHKEGPLIMAHYPTHDIEPVAE